MDELNMDCQDVEKFYEKTMWWGYLHSNGTLQLKRWFGDKKDYTEDCKGNDFVKQVCYPFEAETREKATSILQEKIYGKEVNNE